MGVVNKEWGGKGSLFGKFVCLIVSGDIIMCTDFLYCDMMLCLLDMEEYFGSEEFIWVIVSRGWVMEVI